MENLAFNMDCMEAMRSMPDQCFDLAVVDPPYGIDAANMNLGLGKTKKCSKIQNRNFGKQGWDKNIPPEKYFRELERVSKRQVIFGGNYFTPFLEQAHRGWIVWYKGQQGLTMSDCELAYSTFDTPTRVVIINRAQFQKEGFKIHPTQKPVALYAWIFQHYANHGDRILDTHLGSGSSRIAAWDAGLDFIGYEIDREYFEAQEKRFQQHTAQLSIFGEGVSDHNIHF